MWRFLCRSPPNPPFLNLPQTYMPKTRIKTLNPEPFTKHNNYSASFGHGFFHSGFRHSSANSSSKSSSATTYGAPQASSREVYANSDAKSGGLRVYGVRLRLLWVSAMQLCFQGWGFPPPKSHLLSCQMIYIFSFLLQLRLFINAQNQYFYI